MKMFGWLKKRGGKPTPSAPLLSPETVMNTIAVEVEEKRRRGAAEKRRDKKICELFDKLKIREKFGNKQNGCYFAPGDIQHDCMRKFLGTIADDEELRDAMLLLSGAGMQIRLTHVYCDNSHINADLDYTNLDDAALHDADLDHKYNDSSYSLQRSENILTVRFNSELPNTEALRKVVGLPKHSTAAKPIANDRILKLRLFCDHEVEIAKARFNQLIVKSKLLQAELQSSLREMIESSEDARSVSLDLPGHELMVRQLEKALENEEVWLSKLEKDFTDIEFKSAQIIAYMQAVECSERAKKVLNKQGDQDGVLQAQEKITAMMQAAYALQLACEEIAGHTELEKDKLATKEFPAEDEPPCSAIAPTETLPDSGLSTDSRRTKVLAAN